MTKTVRQQVEEIRKRHNRRLDPDWHCEDCHGAGCWKGDDGKWVDCPLCSGKGVAEDVERLLSICDAKFAGPQPADVLTEEQWEMVEALGAGDSQKRGWPELMADILGAFDSTATDRAFLDEDRGWCCPVEHTEYCSPGACEDCERRRKIMGTPWKSIIPPSHDEGPKPNEE